MIMYKWKNEKWEMIRGLRRFTDEKPASIFRYFSPFVENIGGVINGTRQRCNYRIIILPLVLGACPKPHMLFCLEQKSSKKQTMHLSSTRQSAFTQKTNNSPPCGGSTACLYLTAPSFSAQIGLTR
jgi:hypothetical protein